MGWVLWDGYAVREPRGMRRSRRVASPTKVFCFTSASYLGSLLFVCGNVVIVLLSQQGCIAYTYLYIS